MKALFTLLFTLLSFTVFGQTHVEYAFENGPSPDFTTPDVSASDMAATELQVVFTKPEFTTTNHSIRINRSIYSAFSITPKPGLTLRLSTLSLDLKIQKKSINSEDIIFEVRYGSPGQIGTSLQRISIEAIPNQNEYQITTLLYLPQKDFAAVAGPMQFTFYTSTASTDYVSLDNIILTGLEPLPVELSYFSGKVDTKQVVTLNWGTAMEKDAASFEIQRSNDAQVFVKAGSVAAAGSSTTKKEYAFKEVVKNPLTYYRLKLIDSDGSYKYSKTIAVKTLESNLIRIANPSSSVLSIYAGYTDISLVIIDANGKQLRSYKLKSGANQVNTGLGSGIYVARYIWGGLILKNGLLLIHQ